MKFPSWRQLLPAAACLVATATAGVNTWTSIGPAGGSIMKVAYGVAPGTVYAIAPAGLFQSLDSGATWKLTLAAPLNAPFDVRVDPADTQRVYAAFSDPADLYMSVDGGTTFNPVTTFPSLPDGIQQVALDASGQSIYCSSYAHVYRSSDRARTWQAVGAVSGYSLARFARLVVDPADANSLYGVAYTATNLNGVVASHDGGATWQTLFMDDPTVGQAAFDIAINPANDAELWVARNDGAWKSSDHGITWTNMFGTQASAVAIDPVSPAIVYVGGGYGSVYRTADGGASWTDVTGNVLAGGVRSLAINPTQHASLLVGGDAGLYGSGTSGSNWTARQSGLISTTVSGFTADAAADRIYLTVPEVGLYYTQGAVAGTTAVNNAALALLGGTPDFQYVSAALAQPGRLWASMAVGLAHSEDAGNTWSVVVVPPTGSRQLFHLASNPATPQQLLGATFSTVYVSIDGGTNWSAASGVPVGQVTGVLIAPSNPAVAYAQSYSADGLTNNGVFRSSDAGATFVSAGTNVAAGPTQLLAVHPTNPAVVYGTSNTSLLSSHDSGATWSVMPVNGQSTPGSVAPLAIDPVHPQIMLAYSQLGIIRSVDAGASWQVIRAIDAVPFWMASNLIADPKRPENLLVATYNRGVQMITVSPDLKLALSSNPGTVGVGTPFKLGYQLTNNGPFDATGVHVTLQLPATVQKPSATLAGGTCTLAGTQLTCTIPVLRTAASAALTLNATLPATGAAPITAVASGDQPDAHAQDNSAPATLTVTGNCDLSVTATGTSSAVKGNAVSYSISVQNAGPDTASAPTLSIQVASGLGAVAAKPDKGSCSASGQAITCKLPDLASGSTASVAITATASGTGAMKSTTTISSLVFDSSAANNSASITTNVTAPPAPESSGGGGGALSPLALAALAALSQHRRLRRRGAAPFSP